MYELKGDYYFFDEKPLLFSFAAMISRNRFPYFIFSSLHLSTFHTAVKFHISFINFAVHTHIVLVSDSLCFHFTYHCPALRQSGGWDT